MIDDDMISDPEPEWLERLLALEAKLLEHANPATGTPVGVELDDGEDEHSAEWEIFGLALTTRGWRVEHHPGVMLFYAPLPAAWNNPGDVARNLN